MNHEAVRILAWIVLGIGSIAAAGFAVQERRRTVAALSRILRSVQVAGGADSARSRERLPGSAAGLIEECLNAVSILDERSRLLEEDRRRLRVILESMEDPVIAADGRRRLLLANASADRVFGLDSASTGRFLPELIRSSRIQEALEKVIDGAEEYRGEIMLPGKPGAKRAPDRVFLMKGSALPGTPGSDSLLVFHEVTELRRLERLRQDFVANVSHELKTPLASIKAYAETLLDGAIDDAEVNLGFLKRIVEQADRLNNLILDLIRLARIESTEHEYKHGALVLKPVIVGCVESHGDRAEASDLRLEVELSGIPEDAVVLADEEAVRQILDNLIDNAIKYTPEKGRVRVEGRSYASEVVISVEDSGIGIPRAELSRVFERFYRVDKARSRELGGTGLGLSIVKHLVQSIGGRVEVDSRLGEGSTFTIRLPRSAEVRPPDS